MYYTSSYGSADSGNIAASTIYVTLVHRVLVKQDLKPSNWGLGLKPFCLSGVVNQHRGRSPHPPPSFFSAQWPLTMYIPVSTVTFYFYAGFDYINKISSLL